MNQTYFENTIPRPVRGPLSPEEYFALKSPAPGVRPVRRLVLGTAWAGGVDPSDAIAALHAAWDAGFEMVDTAPMYRNAEQVVGEALKSWQGDRPVVSTKTKQTTSVDEVRTRFEESAQTLGEIDLLAVHDATPDYPPESIVATTDYLSGLVEQGRARAIGQGGGGPLTQAQWVPSGIIRYVITHLRMDAVTLQALNDLIPMAEEGDISILAASPLHIGLLGSNYRTFSEYPIQNMPEVMVNRAREVKRLADEWGLSLTHVALRFVLSMPVANLVLSGAVTPAEWEDCRAAYEAGPLPAELYNALWVNAQQGVEPLMGG